MVPHKYPCSRSHPCIRTFTLHASSFCALETFWVPEKACPTTRRLQDWGLRAVSAKSLPPSSSSSWIEMTMALSVGQNSISALPFVTQHRHTPSRSSTWLSFKPRAFTKSLTLLPSSPKCDSDILCGSTRTLTTLMGLAVLLMKKAAIPVLSINSNSVSTMGTLFFASFRDRSSASGALNTPLTVVAAGLGKWLDIYSGVLMVRVLLSWFPNIPWERQPLSAIRDLCDPYLNLFRNIIPPVFDTLDVSPLLAFAVLGTLGSILQTAM